MNKQNYFLFPVIRLSPSRYLNCVIFLAAILSFVSGIVIDLYAPSLPSLALYFNTSIFMIKNSITVSLCGLAVGGLFFGPLIDRMGHKKIFFIGMFGFSFFNFLSLYSSSISEFLFLRFLQGAFSATAFLVARSLLIKTLDKKRYLIGMSYASIGFGLGPIVGPFIGSYLQYQFGWQANILAYVFIGILLLLLVILFIKEPDSSAATEPAPKIIKLYQQCLQHSKFILSTFILGMVVMQNMTFPSFGPFVIENSLHMSMIVYGYCALFVGLGYLCGTLSNRYLLNFFLPQQLVKLGIILYAISILLQTFFSLSTHLRIVSLIFPIVLASYAIGFVYSNITSLGLQFFPKYSGMAAGFQGFLMIIIGSFNNFLANYFFLDSLFKVNVLYATIFFIQLMLIRAFLGSGLKERKLAIVE